MPSSVDVGSKFEVFVAKLVESGRTIQRAKCCVKVSGFSMNVNSAGFS